MKIPLDFFLITIKKFLDELELKDVSKALKKHLELTEEEFEKILGDKVEELSLRKMLKFYFKNHPEHKSTMKEVKNRIKDIEAEENAETVEESDEKVSSKKNKKAKKDENKNGTAVPEKLLSKKTQRKDSETEKDEEEEKPKKDSKKAKKQEKKEESEEEEEYDFKFKKPIVPSELKNKTPNAPFKRISETIVEKLEDDFKDNSYDTFMMKSGNTYGKEANDKLKVVRGKDFKKEKTKFKNKSSAGSFSISTEIKSIKLDLDSD